METTLDKLTPEEVKRHIDYLWARYRELDPRNKDERQDTLDDITFYTQLLKELRVAQQAAQ